METRRVSRCVLILAALTLLMSLGCSPEAERVRGGGPGADTGNRVPPTQLHGDRARNNPDFQVPAKAPEPRDAWGVPGWWSARAE